MYLLRLSSPGSGNDQQFAVFSDLASSINPDIVIWQFYSNDYFENIIQAIYDPIDGTLKKRQTLTNTRFLAGFLIQKIPFLSNTALGKHLMFLAEFNDFFGNWPVTFETVHEVKNYNKLKITLLLEHMQEMSENYGFEFYTTLAPLECQVVDSIECSGVIDDYQYSLKKILTINSNFVGMQDPLNSSVNILGISTDNESYLFETIKDDGNPGSRHFTQSGNIRFGNILFDNFLVTQLNLH